MRPTPSATLGRYLVMTLMAVAVLLPFVSIILAAFQPSGAQVSGLSLPSSWTWSNFADAWDAAHFNDLVTSSLIIAVCVVPLSIILVTLAAYSLATLDPFGGRLLSTGFVVGLTLARMIRAGEAKDDKPSLRLIGISARSHGDEEALCRAAGMDAFLRKPVTGEMLAAVFAEPE